MRQVLLAASIGLIFSLFGTPVAIRLLVRQGYGQLIRDDGPTSHHTKRGTPTMGGAVIILGTLFGYFGAHLVTLRTLTVSGLLVIFLMTGLGLVGFIDDYIKVAKQRSLGLGPWAKLIGQMVVAVTFAVLAMNFADNAGFTPASTEVSFIRDTGLGLGAVLFVVWAFVMIAGTSNGVNLTDGLDGLATGTSVMVFASYILIGTFQFANNCATDLTRNCYEVRDPLDLAVVAAAVMGACFGFLWWNASPAKIFMGDTGSLALGGALAGLALTTRTQLLLVLIGGLFVLIALSVIMQVSFFKLTGRRVFRMAPLQHHFELVGWGEVTIVIRFWIIAAILNLAALATLKLR